MTTAYRFRGEGLISDEHFDLAMSDSRGRRIGARVQVMVRSVYEFEPYPDSCFDPDPQAAMLPVGSRHIFARVQATRNGRTYGASQPGKYLCPEDDPSMQEAIATYVERRITAMKKRYLAEVKHKQRHGMTSAQRRRP